MTTKKHKKSKGKKTPKIKQKRSFFWWCVKWLFVLGVWGGIALGGVVLWYAKDLPDITQSAVFERRASIVVKAADGTILARYGESKGESVAAKELPGHLVNAILATEDRRFYQHRGIDPWGITRAMIKNVIKGRFVQGGSTITQQLAKNLFLSHRRTIDRKIQEALLALWLEHALSKDDILSAYVNRVYLGSGTYGFEAAAQLYFGKSARDVNLLESAVLAGLLKAPSRYSPHQNPSLAKERANTVLVAMADAGYITPEQQKNAQEQKLLLPHRKSDGDYNARYFADWVINGLDDLVGVSDTDIVIDTTLDTALQSKAQRALIQAIDSTDEMQFVSQGAILSLSPDGAVRAMVGGKDYTQSEFNRTVQARRPPGSAFKPFVFLAALESGWQINNKILDSPVVSGSYRPKNFADQYYGTVDLETALAKSLNTATVRLAEKIGIGTVIRTAQRLGILSDLSHDLSLSLGSSGVSMLELGTAYAVLANGGYKVYPYAITRISTQDGDVLFEREAVFASAIIVKDKHVANMKKMMRSVILHGTGKSAKLPFPAQGKTGTSQDSRDAWFAGYSDRLVTLVWLGNDDNSPMRRITGGGLPARIWKDVMLFGHPRHMPAQMVASEDERDFGGFSGLLNRLTQAARSPSGKKPGDFSDLND